MPTIGTLSGRVATAAKLGSRYDRPIESESAAKSTTPPFLVQSGRQ